MLMMDKQRKMPKSPGRPAGKPNNITSDIREQISKAIKANGHKLGHWFNRIEAEQGAEAALLAYCKLAEYALPKQRFVEVQQTASINILAILDKARERVVATIDAQKQQAIGSTSHMSNYVKCDLPADVVYAQHNKDRIEADIAQAYDDPLAWDDETQAD